MPTKQGSPKNNKDKKGHLLHSSKNETSSSTRVGNIDRSKGIAIGTNVRSTVIEIGSLLDFSLLQKILKQYWCFLTINIPLQGTLAAIWQNYTDRFLIPSKILLVEMLLLEICLVSIYFRAMQSRQRQIFTILGITSLVGLIGLTGFEYDRVVYPAKFDRETFGVAVAQFGEGPDLRNTDRARDIGQAVLQQLTQQAQQNPNLRFVQFKSIGLVRTIKEASEDGQRIGADLVIWGRLQVSEEKTILNFSILETPDKVSNPMFPRVFPLFEPATNGFVRIDSRGSEEIAKGTTAISAFTFGLAHFFKWDFASAARAFEEAPITSLEEGDDYRYLLHIYYGLSLQWPRQLEKANEEFRQAIELHPDDPAPRIARAYGYYSLGRFAEAKEEARIAVKLCNERVQLDSTDYRAFFDRALADELLQDWDSALLDYQASKQRAPDLYVAHIGVARMHLALNQIPEAVLAAQEAIKLAESREANPAWAYVYLAAAYERNQDVVNARLAYKKATSLAPQVDWIHFQAGQFYSSTGDPKDLLLAEQEYSAMIKVSSNQAWAHATLADFYVKHSRPEDAVAEYRAALQTDSEAASIWVALADVLSQLKRINDAREAYSRAIDLEPHNYYAQFKYGNFFFTQGELEAAIQHWEIARQINPHNCGLLLNMGRAYEVLGDQAKAETFYLMVPGREVTSDQQC